MSSTSTLPAVASVQLDTLLADALVLSWSDLMPERTSGLIHIEYHAGFRGLVEFPKLWASTTRGYRDLVCEHSTGQVPQAKADCESPTDTNSKGWRECSTRSCDTMSYS